MGIEFNGNVNNNNLYVGNYGEKKEVKQTEAQPVPVGQTPETKQADASSLDALGWQNMGLQLSNKKNVNETIIAAQQMLNDLVFDNDVDKTKVSNYIKAANADRIATEQKVYQETVRELEAENTKKTAENLFKSPEFKKLDNLFGIQ